MKQYNIEIKWAIAFVLMSLGWMLLERLSGLHHQHIDKHEIYTNFIALPAIAIYVFALLDKRKNFYGGTISYKQGFISGLIITLIVTAFSPLTQYITFAIITPDYFPNAIKYSVDAQRMTQQEANDFFSLKNYIVQGLIGAPIMGLATTAIVAIFTKQTNK